MAMQQNAPQTIRGEVEAVNEKGVRIGGAWYNFSRYHSVPSPYRDELVEPTVPEGEPWIERLVVLEDSKGCTVLHQPEADPAPDLPRGGPQQPLQPRGCRDRLIVRQTALKCAVTLAAGKPDVSSADVLKVAERFAAWVLAEEGGNGAPAA